MRTHNSKRLLTIKSEVTPSKLDKKLWGHFTQALSDI